MSKELGNSRPPTEKPTGFGKKIQEQSDKLFNKLEPGEKNNWFKKTTATVALTGTLVSFPAEAAYIAEKETGAITRLFEPNPKDIPSEVPPQLRGKDIPQTNEHFRPFAQVVQEGIDNYVKGGGKPFYKQPDYYLTEGEAIATTLTEGLGSFRETHMRDKRYGDALNFYSGAYFDPVDLVNDDPGTSSKIDAEKRLADHLGYNPQTILERGTRALDEESKHIINKTYAEHYSETKEAIDAMRGTEQISTSKIFEYYLNKDDGDIARSLLDTTLFIRFTVRGDAQDMLQPETFTKAEADEGWGRKNAELFNEMFRDEFSTGVPQEWLIKNVSPDDKDLNSEDTDVHTEWKDYMPVNRAGTPYHIWSMAGMASIMDPELVQQAITFDELRTSWPEHGRIKIKTDELALRDVRKVRDIFDEYKVD